VFYFSLFSKENTKTRLENKRGKNDERNKSDKGKETAFSCFIILSFDNRIKAKKEKRDKNFILIF
jgi:hypothetical protein